MTTREAAREIRDRYLQSAHELDAMLGRVDKARDAGDEETASTLQAAVDARLDDHRALFLQYRNARWAGLVA